MAQPAYSFTGKLVPAYWRSGTVSQTSIKDMLAAMLAKMPNINAIAVKTHDGDCWMGAYDTDKPDFAISSADDVYRWVKACAEVNLDFVAWCLVTGKNPDAEVALAAAVCNTPGVRALILDVEEGSAYFNGGPKVAQAMAQAIRAKSNGIHIGLCFDARGQHPRGIYIDAWLPYVDSLHPMVYPGTFGVDPAEAVDDAFNALAHYSQPVTPWLQSHSLDSPNILLDAAKRVFAQHADRAQGIALWRLGDDVMHDKEKTAVSQVVVPNQVVKPRPNPDPIKDPGGYTNQQVINAFAAAAEAQGTTNYWQWVVNAGLESMVDARDWPYAGPPILNLPGLSADQKSLIQRALAGEDLTVPFQHDDDVHKYTNQQVINAFVEAARLAGNRDQFWQWVVQAGLQNIASNRTAAYTGPVFSQLPNLTQGQKQSILDVLLADVPAAITVPDGAVKLSVPWQSQMDSHGMGNNNCGQASLTMVLKYYQKAVTFNMITSAKSGKSGAADIDRLAQKFGLPELYVDTSFVNADSLRAPLDAKCPVILLVNYLDLNLPNHLYSGNNQGWHWIVVVGYEQSGYYFHDPLWLASQERQASYILRSGDVMNKAMVRIGGKIQALYASSKG